MISRHDYLPSGEEIPAGYAGRPAPFGASDGVSLRFTGQYRDSETGLDFFNARYFGAALGRFNSPDPMNAGADVSDPQTWNGYAYVRNNPLNAVDPSGLCGGIVAGISSDPWNPKGGGFRLLQIAAHYGYDIAYPYAGQSKLAGIFSVLGQSLGFKNGATGTAAAMVQDVSAQSGATTSLYTGWSGGAISMQLGGVNPQSPTAAQAYFSPGGATLPDPSQNQNALVFSGSGALDSLVNATSSGPSSNPSILYPDSPGCGHDAACMWNSHLAEINSLVSGNGVQSCPNPTVFLPHGVRIPLSSLVHGGGGGNPGGANSTITYQPNYGEFGWWGLWVNARPWPPPPPSMSLGPTQ